MDGDLRRKGGGEGPGSGSGPAAPGTGGSGSAPGDDGGRPAVRVAAPGEFAGVGARLLAGAMREALGGDDGTCTLALAGGSTPLPVYRRLAGAGGIDWSRVEVFFGDERAVSPEHAASNYRGAREALLDRVPIPDHRIHRMPADAGDREAAAEAYGRALPRQLDVLVLGIGEDGHTASLFPGSPALAERHRRVVPVKGPKPPVRRMTVTPPVLRTARRILVLAAGEEKAPAVARALESEVDPGDCPARLARRGTWVLDRAAAGRLGAGAAPAPDESEGRAGSPGGAG